MDFLGRNLKAGKKVEKWNFEEYLLMNNQNQLRKINTRYTYLRKVNLQLRGDTQSERWAKEKTYKRFTFWASAGRKPSLVVFFGIVKTVNNGLVLRRILGQS